MNEERTLSTIEELQAQIRVMEQELGETKRTVNFLCRRIHRDPIYKETDQSSSLIGTRSDEFYGKPLASVVRTILERRAAANMGAASVDAVFAAMKSGGYLFNAKNDSTAKTALATSMAKNTSTFHKLPNGDFGLLEWYPSIPVRARPNGRAEETEEKEESVESADSAAQHEDGLAEPYTNEFAETAESVTTAPVGEPLPRRKRGTAKEASPSA